MTREGTVLDGKYEILKEIGRGGMSIVYLARDNRLNKQWAVKEIKNDGSKDTETLLKGLEREANILKNVDHPVLPRIVDIIKSRGTIYVVMDFIEGTNLADVLKAEGAQPQENVIDWAIQLASALDYLHSMNPPIIYRDMKPSNVMLRPEGGVKLIDFGTAKEYTIENNADTTALGTRGYAAPEQFGDKQGRGIYNTDARTDIYNLGATLYHMVTGMNPSEPPYEIKPIRQWNTALSTGLEQIIIKCTQPNPEDRYQSCSELLYALDHYTELDDSYKKSNKKKVILFGAAVLFTIAGAIVSVVGYNGMKRVEKENYSSYIESGNNEKVSRQYKKAAEEYKKAFDLNDEDADAYVSYIDLYIDASKDPDAEGENALTLSDGLSIIANRVNNSDSKLNKNAEVLYRLGLAYFTELSDYGAADKYFRMVPSDDPDYGELAGYYESIAFILSSNNVNVQNLMEKVDGFANYNMTHFNNSDEQKFVNYRMLGRIYTTYIGTENVAEQAERVMAQAVSDLENYSGEDSSQYDYDFHNSLSEIYYQLGKVNDDAASYKLAISACKEVANQASGKMSMNAAALESATLVSYRKAYEEKMCRIAEIYEILEDPDNARKTYQEAEAALAKSNLTQDNLGKVYTKHLLFLYNEFKRTHGDDITTWPKAARDEILSVYTAGLAIPGIENNSNWLKMVTDMETLKSLQDGTAKINEEGVLNYGNV